MLHTLLVDDEASARADLREKLLAHGNVTIVGEAATLSTARALLTNADYDLVFLDVELIGGKSFDLVPAVRPGASIVFATAHERYAVRAFESHAVDYLLKPIDRGRLAESLRRAAGIAATGSATPFASSEPRVIAENASEVALTRHESTFLRQMLEAWEDSLSPTHILRVQRAQTRTVRYEINTEPTRLFLAGARLSTIRRWWRALRS